MKGNNFDNLIWIIFANLGIIIIIVGVIVKNTIYNYDNKIEITGIITEISYHRDIDDNREYDVYVSYTVEGKKYETKLNGYSSNFYEGKEIKIYYDKDNPNKIGMKSLELLFLIFPGIGTIFLIIGVIGISIKLNKKRWEKKLKVDGKLIYANYSETVLNTSYQVNGKCPYKIICEWEDPLDNKRYIFKSKNIWINPEEIIAQNNITQFPIYINNNKKKYYIDLDILNKNIVDLR